MDMNRNVEPESMAQETSIRPNINAEELDIEGQQYKRNMYDNVVDDDDEFVTHLELHNAATNGTVQDFKQVLERISSQTNDQPLTIIDLANLSGNTLLHSAVNGKNEDVAIFLAENLPSLILESNNKGDTALHIAARHGMRRIVRIFAESSETPISEMAGDFLVRENEHGNIALHEAVMARDYRVAQILISRYPMSIYYANRQGWSALSMAIRNGDLPIFELMLDSISQNHALLERLKEVEADPPAHAAICHRRIGMLEKMADRCKQLVKLRDEKGRTCLHFAADEGDIDAVRLLVSHWITSCYQMDKSGVLPIHVAARKGHVRIIEALLEYTCDPRVLLTGATGQNILHLAAKYGKDNVVRYILRNPTLRKLLNERDNEGNTALHLAAKHAHPAVVLSLTWDPNIHLNSYNNDCLTPLDFFSTAFGAYLKQHLLQLELTVVALVSAGCEASSGSKIDEGSYDSEASFDTEISENFPKKAVEYEWMNDHVGALLTIATLVTTGTFTAGFTLPGGSISSGEANEGKPIMLNNHTFQFFTLCNSIAFFCSIICIISCFYSKYADIFVAARSYYLAVVFFGLSLLMMSLAFAAAIQLAVRNVSWLTCVTLIATVMFLVFLFLWWVVNAFPFHWRNPAVRFVSNYVIRGCVFVFLSKH